ncbi:MAG: hypothetical protein RJB66_1816 [Pseudomonadota bacterium]|jgi:pimeloyl-ACP methyl ester carboxylesterase
MFSVQGVSTVKLQAFFLALFVGAYSGASTISDHPDRPFLSSIPALFMNAPSFKPEAVETTLTSGRSLPSQYNKTNQLSYTYALQPRHDAPVIVVIPGLGGTAESGGSLFLAQIAFLQGYSVITLPSSTHWSFALAASKSGRPGYLPHDAKDHYQLLTKIKRQLEKDHNIRPSRWGLMGYSYGGLDSTFLMAEDRNQNVFNFNFLVLISPPLNRATAISKIDQYYAQGHKVSEANRQKLASFGMGRVVEIMQGKVKINTFEDLQTAFPLKESSLAWLLANEFRRALQNSAFIGDLVSKRGTTSISETIPASISEYLNNEVFSPLSKKHPELGSPADLAKQSELMHCLNSHNQSLLKEKKIVLFHSSNDFISFPEGEHLLKTLAFKSYIYPFGGHLGFLSDKGVIDDLKATLRNLK